MDTTTPASGPWASTPPPAPPAARPPLVRSRINRKIAGVASGLAAWLGIDPWAVRLILVVLMIPFGLGLLGYLIGWVLMPDADGKPAAAEGLVRRLQGAPSWVPIVLLVAVVLFFFQSFWLGAPLAVFWAILLIAAGGWLYHNDAQRNRPAPAPGGHPLAGTAGPMAPIGPVPAAGEAGQVAPAGAPGGHPLVDPAAGPALASATSYPGYTLPAVPSLPPAGTEAVPPSASAIPAGSEVPASGTAGAGLPAGPTPALAAASGALQLTQPIPAPSGGDPVAGSAWPGATPPWGTGPVPPQWATPACGGAGKAPGPFPPTGWTQPVPVAKVKVKKPKERSPLGRITFAAALVVLGITALIDRLGIAHISGRLYPALALIVLGVGLLIGALWGKAKLLILVGLVVVPIALLTNLAVFVNHNGSGSEFFYPAATAGLKRDYRLGAGQIRLDLTRMVWPPSGAVTTHITVGAGNLEVSVPPDVTVNFHGHVGTGVIQFMSGPQHSGIQISDDTISAGTPGGPTLNLWVHVLSGRVAVSRIYPSSVQPSPATPPKPLIAPLAPEGP